MDFQTLHFFDTNHQLKNLKAKLKEQSTAFYTISFRNTVP
jgi:hypothetical protein